MMVLQVGNFGLQSASSEMEDYITAAIPALGSYEDPGGTESNLVSASALIFRTSVQSRVSLFRPSRKTCVIGSILLLGLAKDDLLKAWARFRVKRHPKVQLLGSKNLRWISRH